MSTSITPSELLAHMDWVERLAQRLVHDPEQAEDLVQDTWLKALTRPPRHAGNLRAWLGSALRNQARDSGRSESSRVRREGKAARAEGQAVVEQATVQHEVVDLVLKLEEPYRTVLLMRYFQDMAVREIASKQGIGINTVRSQLVRAHGQVRESLDRRYASEGGRRAWAGLLLGATGSAALKGSLATPLLALGLVLVVSLGGGALWKVLGSERPARREEALHLGAELNQISAPQELATGATAPASGRQQADANSQAPEEVLSKASASILLEIQDERTGTPLGDLSWIVYEEGAGKNLLARGKTDARGRARIPDMPCEDVLIVRTERRAPNAPGFGAVWLESEKPERLLLKVGSGSSAKGRVVDTQGMPLPGIEIVSDTRAEGSLRLTKGNAGLSRLSGLGYAGGGSAGGRPGQYQEVLAVSDEEGRWQVDHLSNMPEGVWIVDGKLRPEAWTPIKLRVRDPAWPGARYKELIFGLEQNSALDLGDVQLPATGTLTGRVLNMQAEPMPGMLVFTTDERFGPNESKLPFPNNFNFAPGHLTDSDGRFEVDTFGGSLSHYLVVHQPSGAFKASRHFGRLGPGDRLDVTISIGIQSTVHLNLRGTQDLPLFSGSYRPEGPGRSYPSIKFGLSGGDLVHELPVEVRDGVLIYRLDPPLKSVVSLEVRYEGFRPRWIPFPSPTENSHELKLQLTPLHSIKLETLIEEWALKPGAGLRIELHKASPSGEVVASKSAYYGENEMTLHISDPGEYWATIDGFPFGTSETVVRGPFQTGELRHELEIRSSDWKPGANYKPAKLAEPPVQSTTPPAAGILPKEQGPIPEARFTMDVRDRSTGLALPQARISYQPVEVESRNNYRASSYYDHSTYLCVLEYAPGSYTLGAFCEGYQRTELPNAIHGAAGQQVDLGIIYMDPLEELSGKVTTPEGVPFAHKRIRWALNQLRGEAITDDRGRFKFKGTLGDQAPWLGYFPINAPLNLDHSIGFIHIKESSSPTEHAFHTIQKTEVRLAIQGLTPTEFFEIARVRLIAKPNTETTDGYRPRFSAEALASPDGKTRLYRAFVVPGDYDVELTLRNQEPHSRAISIVAPDELQSFVISIR